MGSSLSIDLISGFPPIDSGYPVLSPVEAAQVRLELLLESNPQLPVSGRGPGSNIPENYEASDWQPDLNRELNGYPGQNKSLIDSPDTVRSQHSIGAEEYFPQPNDWSCGAAVYITALRALNSQTVELEQAINITGANENTGTDNFLLQKAFEQLKPELEVITGISSHTTAEMALEPELRLQEQQREYSLLKQLLKDGYLVIINFREPVDNGGHYGILQGLNDQAIEIADPWYGNHSVLPLSKFDFRSGYTTPVLHGWFIAIRSTLDEGSNSLSRMSFSIPT